jgi:hypothetical protein
MEVTDTDTDTDKVLPLQCKWTLYYDSGDETKEWNERLVAVYTFDNVETFWRLFNNIKSPKQFESYQSYYLFRDGIKPSRECEENKGGGVWTSFLSNNYDRKHVDDYWLYFVLLMIGGTFMEEYEKTSGICISMFCGRGDRQHDRLSLWIKGDCTQEMAEASLTKHFARIKFRYKAHE